MRAASIASLVAWSTVTQAWATSSDPVAMSVADALVAGEVGDASAALGDHVRLMLWMQALGLQHSQLQALADAATRVGEGYTVLLAQTQEVAAEEQVALTPVHDELTEVLVAGVVTEQVASELAAQLSGALGMDVDPRVLRMAWVQLALTEAGNWMSTLTPSQIEGMTAGAFLLRPPSSVELVPAHTNPLLAVGWDAGRLDGGARGTSAGPLSPGGLGGDPVGDAAARRVLVAAALAHPQTVPAAAALTEPREVP